MRLTCTATLLALAGLCTFSAGTASAQIVSPYAQPNFRPGYRTQLSPYLNLIRGGDPAANYYLGTLPEQQRRQLNQQFSSNIQTLEEQEQRLELAPQDKDLAGTKIQSGHGTASNTTLGYYGDTRGYYPTKGAIAGTPVPKTPKR